MVWGFTVSNFNAQLVTKAFVGLRCLEIMDNVDMDDLAHYNREAGGGDDPGVNGGYAVRPRRSLRLVTRQDNEEVKESGDGRR